jgi:glutathione synthase/RimK-type ligase-like ATP-grasp enzyme
MSEHLILVENANHWKPDYPNYRVVTAKEYLADTSFAAKKGLRVVNLCRSQRYLSVGYYCSLLAEARGHRVIPGVRAIQDLSYKSIYSLSTEDLDKQLQRILARRKKDLEITAFSMSVFFGQCQIRDMQPLARELFEIFPVPLMSVEFRLQGSWRISAIKNIPLSGLTPDQEECFLEGLGHYLSSRWHKPKRSQSHRYDLAILHDPQEQLAPTNAKGLRNFIRAAKELGINAELIEAKDYGKLLEYDALFIRETTRIDHHTYRFARKAAKSGMVVIDDPDSILKCTNKIYLAELLANNRVPTPKTVVVRPDSLDELEAAIPYPIVLKVPDGAFSRGVFKVENRRELEIQTRKLFKESDLLLAQEFTYTEFDWRVGILNRRPLFVCQYFMSKEHWQIVDHAKGDMGLAKTFLAEEAPRKVVETALKAASLIGNGLYGVDIKETPKGMLVIEVNDNPNIDAGIEDLVLKEGLYRSVMGEFLRRMQAIRDGLGRAEP